MELIFLQRDVQGCTFQKNYEFEFDFGPPWGHCGVTMTSVSGHLLSCQFGPEIPKYWANHNPVHCFDAPVRNVIDAEVCALCRTPETYLLTEFTGGTEGGNC